MDGWRINTSEITAGEQYVQDILGYLYSFTTAYHTKKKKEYVFKNYLIIESNTLFWWVWNWVSEFDAKRLRKGDIIAKILAQGKGEVRVWLRTRSTNQINLYKWQ
jgi:hypothetical protein